MSTLNVEIKTTAGAQWLVMLAKSKLRLANRGYGDRSRAMSELNRARAKLRHIKDGTKPAAQEDIDFVTMVAGIACGVVVDHVEPSAPAKTWGAPETCHPAEGGHADWHLTDRDGYRALWLESKLTRDDERRITDQALKWSECNEGASNGQRY